MADRSNQKARTRAALLDAAVALVREGRPPSMQDAADTALVSVATAYRYFPSAEELWFEATAVMVDYAPELAEAEATIAAAGEDPLARLDAAIRTVSFHMVDDPVPFRRLARSSLDQWFAQQSTPVDQRTPVREQRRRRHITLVLQPLEDEMPDAQLDRIAHALGVVMGTDAVLALTDGMGLSDEAAKEAMVDAARWLLTGALAELDSQPDP
jgi:AcrR family transcriptional regulator